MPSLSHYPCVNSVWMGSPLWSANDARNSFFDVVPSFLKFKGRCFSSDSVTLELRYFTSVLSSSSEISTLPMDTNNSSLCLVIRSFLPEASTRQQRNAEVRSNGGPILRCNTLTSSEFVSSWPSGAYAASMCCHFIQWSDSSNLTLSETDASLYSICAVATKDVCF